MVSVDTRRAAQLWAVEPSTVDGHVRIRARIAGLHCSLCTATIEKALGRMDGVGQVAVSLTHEQALVDYDPTAIGPERILSTLRDIGYELYDPRKLRPFEEEEAQLVHEGVRLLAAITASLTAIGLIATVTGIASVLVPLSVVVLMVPLSYAILRKAGTGRALLGAAGIVAPGVAALILRASGLLPGWLAGWLAGAVALAVVAGVAHHILRMAYQSLRRGILNQHVLVEIGAFAGLAGGAIGLSGVFAGYPTAAFFAVSVLVANYHVFSEWLSLLVKTRSSQAVKKMLDLQPDLARVVRDGAEADVPVEQVIVGDLIRIRPGERIPVDGRVVDGYSTVDLSLVTGEPIPQERRSGDTVVSGALNGTGTLLVRATAPAAGSFLAQVVRHVEDARALKPGVLHLVDRILRVYTPTVVSVSALALTGWLLASWATAGTADVRRAVFAALSVLVMGYPCAVGIAAPLAIVRGSGEAADLGIIMRTGEAFQTFRQVTHVLLDKTGTLTVGRPTVAGLHPAPGVDADQLLATTAAAEAPSEHPLAQAITDTARQRRLTLPPADPDGFQATAGFGVTARIAGHRVLAGRPTFLTGAGVDLTGMAEAITRRQSQGHTVIAVARDTHLLGMIALADTPRPEAAEAVAAMRAAGLTPVLVTGDNPRAARHIAAQLGITDVHAEVLPDGKAALVGQLQAQGARVAMVGDGINDAPALMRADVGVALGSATDIATESADIIIVRAVGHGPGVPGVGDGRDGRLGHQPVPQLHRWTPPPAGRADRQRRPHPHPRRRHAGRARGAGVTPRLAAHRHHPADRHRHHGAHPRRRPQPASRPAVPGRRQARQVQRGQQPVGVGDIPQPVREPARVVGDQPQPDVAEQGGQARQRLVVRVAQAPAQRGQQAREYRQVARAQRAPGGQAGHQPPTRDQHPTDLGQHGRQRGGDHQPHRADHHVDAGIGDRQRGSRRPHQRPGAARPGPGQLARGDVDAQVPPAGLAGPQRRAATGQVEHPTPGRHGSQQPVVRVVAAAVVGVGQHPLGDPGPLVVEPGQISGPAAVHETTVDRNAVLIGTWTW